MIWTICRQRAPSNWTNGQRASLEDANFQLGPIRKQHGDTDDISQDHLMSADLEVNHESLNTLVNSTIILKYPKRP